MAEWGFLLTSLGVLAWFIISVYRRGYEDGYFDCTTAESTNKQRPALQVLKGGGNER